MHYLIANLLILFLLPARKMRLETAVFLIAGMSFFTIYYMSGSADYKGYLTYFSCSQNQFCLRSGDLNFESSFAVLSNFFYGLVYKAGGTWVIAFYSTLGLIIKILVMRSNARHFGMAVFCYASYAWYVHEMTQIRVGLAIAFFWLAVLSFSRRKHFFSVAWLLVAIFFHVSSILGAIVYCISWFKISCRRFFQGSMILATIGVLISDSPAFLNTLLSLGFVDPRIATYSDAIGNIVSSTNFLTVYFVVSVVLLGIYAYQVPDDESSSFEQLGFKLGCVGVVFYSLLYWVPTIGLRGLEFLLSFTPFIAAATWRPGVGALTRLFGVVLIVAIFYNLVVRNGTRTDFVLPGQAQELWME